MVDVSNAEIMQILVEMRRQIQNRDEPLDERLDQVRCAVMDLGRRMEILEKTVANSLTKEYRRDSCPFRDDIHAASNNKARLANMETKVHRMELDMVRAGMYGGAFGGGVMGFVTMFAFAMGKLAGWW